MNFEGWCIRKVHSTSHIVIKTGRIPWRYLKIPTRRHFSTKRQTTTVTGCDPRAFYLISFLKEPEFILFAYTSGYCSTASVRESRDCSSLQFRGDRPYTGGFYTVTVLQSLIRFGNPKFRWPFVTRNEIANPTIELLSANRQWSRFIAIVLGRFPGTEILL